MNVAVKLNSYSFYHTQSTIYVSGLVVEKQITEKTHKDIGYFQTVQKGRAINLKYTGGDSETIIPLLTDLILYFEVSSVEQPRDNKSTHKFIIEQARRCEMFKEKSSPAINFQTTQEY